MGVALRVVSLLLVGTALSGAQGGPAQAQVCDMSMRSVTVKLLSRAGRPVPDAAIMVRRVQRRTLVTGAESLGGGNYKVLEDGMLNDLRPGGEPFDVTFRRDDRMQRVRLIIGMDAGRCHVALKGGRTTVRL